MIVITIHCGKCKQAMKLVSNVEHDEEPGYSTEYWCGNCKRSVEVEWKFDPEVVLFEKKV